ncbi:MAG: hypothetical protein HY690_18105 [Chloroflexi bacterium]|nr:hypothetical protein [Chloroflexota bacterium]
MVGYCLVPSETWGDRFLVPADAEIVIEGEIPLLRTWHAWETGTGPRG